MKYKDFREHKIIRTCTRQYKNYISYREKLSSDFKHRCAYCNMLDSYIQQNYSIDHFIPRKVFKDTEMAYLEYDYNNLMYSCPKCNNSKKDQYEGNIYDKTYNNDFFYNPVYVDYNTIFYRDEYGGIQSEDLKGREMIIRLKLYKGIYHLAFLIEEIENTLIKINSKINQSTGEEKEYYNEAYRKLNNFLLVINKLFSCSYYESTTKFLDSKFLDNYRS